MMRQRWIRSLSAATMLAAALALPARAESTYDPLTSPALTGDRADLAAEGATFDATVTNIGQGVIDGGKNGAWKYSGRADMMVNLDTQKMGLWPGGFFSVEIEGSWGAGVNGKTGALMPVNASALFPEPINDSLNVPQVSFMQFVSPYAGLIAGKLDTMTGDANEFAHGKGDKQFMNLSLNINPILLVTFPYSTLGAGIILLPTKDPHEAVVSFLAVQGGTSASTTGFDDLDGDKVTFAGEGRLRTDFFSLTGHQLVGGSYSNKKFTSIDQRIGDITQTGSLAPSYGSWNVFYNFDQYVYETTKGSGRGVGIFGRFGASDGDPNLMHYFYSLGLSANGVVPSRDFDSMGIGTYYLDVNSPSLKGPRVTRSILSDEWGFEAYYNFALTPWLIVTPDIQVIGPSQDKRIVNGNPRTRENIDTATILGFRMQIIL